jgi:hypothetical protein
LEPGFFNRQAARQEALGRAVEMGLHLVAHFAVDGVAAEDGAEAGVYGPHKAGTGLSY